MKRLEIYKCDVCGNIVEVLFGETDALVCCGQDMDLLKENTTDAAVEKHVPVIEKSGDTVTVTVGSVEHPMTAEHYIQWIELIVGNKSYTQFLKPGEKPQAVFKVDETGVMTAREHCNLHGLWKVEK